MSRIRIPVFAVLVAGFALHAAAQSIDAYAPPVMPTSLAIQPDGRTIVVGNFLDVGATPRTRVARLNVDGSLDAGFGDADVDGEVKTVAVQADGKILIGGSFDHVAGQVRHRLARLDADGSLDTTFADPDFDDTVWSIALQPDGRILAAGDFQHVGATARKYLARVTAGGALDAGFADPQLCCNVARAVALQADGHVLVGGFFSQAGGVSHFYFARFSSGGAFDAAFPAYPRDIQAGSIVVAPDGSLYVADLGTEQVLKLTPDGAAAPGFTSVQADSTIDTIALQPNGKIVIGGIFQNVAGQPRHALARLAADGSLDGAFRDLHFSFDATNPNGYVFALAAQADGAVVVAGNFSFVDGHAHSWMARVATGEAAASAMTGQASGADTIVTWTRGGAGPEVALPPQLLYSSDGVNYAALGAMTRIAGGWRYDVPHAFAGPAFYVKARGVVVEGAGNGAQGRIDSPVYGNDLVFANGFEASP